MTRRELQIFWLVGERLGNREIAGRLHLSERTVESHVSSLLRKLGGTSRLALVETAGRLRARGAALPRPLSSFVGREREIAELTRLAGAHRLLSLTGPAGIGKTRLALHLAHTVTVLPPAVLVDLAPVPPGGPVERTFADALGIAGDGKDLGPLIRSALADEPCWLVVDNCEHVTVGTATLLAELLATAGGLHVLATSHGPLGVAGEVVMEIPPLSLPEEDADLPAVLASASARLFADRAAAVAPGFEATPANARQIAKICRRLDGLPLAIELAAVRVRFFSPAELLGRLDDRFALLTDGPRPGRHRTLEEALRWSYELLDDDERLLLERCSVFPAEFDYDTAARVLSYPPLGPADLVRIFPRLLDRSLISRRRRDEITEYRLLDSVRQFAYGKLAERGAVDGAREQHTRHHLCYGVSLLPDLRGRDQVNAFHWFNRRWTDLRTAMHGVLDEGDTAAAWEFLAGVGTGWEVLGARGELFEWLDALLAHPLPEGPLGARAAVTCCVLLSYQDTERALEFASQAMDRAEDEEDQALAVLSLGWAMAQGKNRASAVGVLEQAVSLFERLGNDWHRAMALSLLGQAASDTDTALARHGAAADLFGRLHDHVKRANCLNHMGIRVIREGDRLDDAETWLTEAARLARRVGNDHERLHAEIHRASLAQHREDHATARTRFAALLPEFRRIGDLRCAAACLYGLGRTAMSDGDPETARLHLTAGAEIAAGLGDLRVMVTGLRLLAEADYATGDLARAATLLGAADHPVSGAPDDQALRTALSERLGSADFAAALAAGHRTPVIALLNP